MIMLLTLTGSFLPEPVLTSLFPEKIMNRTKYTLAIVLLLCLLPIIGALGPVTAKANMAAQDIQN